MKIKFFVAFVATAVIIFLSCNWFRSKKKEVHNPLIGEWRLDSIKIGKDTSFASAIMAMAIQDSNEVNVSITRDTIFSHSQNVTDTIAYSFNEKTNQLTTKDSVLQTMGFAKLNDSLIALTTKDSAIVFLKKK